MKAWPSLRLKSAGERDASSARSIDARRVSKRRRGGALRSVSEQQRQQRQRWWMGLSAVAVLAAVGGLLYPQWLDWQAQRAIAAEDSTATQRPDPGLKRVIFQGDTRGVDVQGLAQKLQEKASAGYLALEPEWIRALVEAEPWVRAAAVRKDWEGVLEIQILRQQPWARWQNPEQSKQALGYVNAQGAVFVPSELDAEPQRLPLLQGNARDAEAMVELFQRSSEALRAADPTASLVRLHMNTRGAVQLELASGLVIELGRRAISARLQRMTHALQQLRREGVEVAEIQRLDVRYSRGFAMRLQKTAQVQHSNTQEGLS
ncbi:MAG: cell division protein FtsQ/DivIB [Gammaproteobacteria bacterium]